LEKYVRHPRVTVTVQEIHSRVVYVTGEVLRPGAYALADTIDVVQLIARAGGVTAYAKRKSVYVLRSGSGLRAKVDYNKVLRGQRLEENVQLNPGDTVVVP
jgi:polysaccharide export outer membrane protein